jgi:hypothetical protein
VSGVGQRNAFEVVVIDQYDRNLAALHGFVEISQDRAVFGDFRGQLIK